MKIKVNHFFHLKNCWMVQCELYTTPKAALRFQGIKTQVSRVPKNLVAKECADWCANYLAGSSVSKESAFYPVFAVLYQTQFSAMIRKNITSSYRCAKWHGQIPTFWQTLRQYYLSDLIPSQEASISLCDFLQKSVRICPIKQYNTNIFLTTFEALMQTKHKQSCHFV